MSKKIDLPAFADEDEEREFWSEIDLSRHFQPADFDKVSFPNLKPSSVPVSIRFPEYLLDAVKEKANKMGVPYQSLIKEAVAKAYLNDED